MPLPTCPFSSIAFFFIIIIIHAFTLLPFVVFIPVFCSLCFLFRCHVGMRSFLSPLEDRYKTGNKVRHVASKVGVKNGPEQTLIELYARVGYLVFSHHLSSCLPSLS